MEAQETSHNTHLTPHAGQPGQQTDTSEWPVPSNQNTPTDEEATIKLTIEQAAQKGFAKTEEGISIAIEGNAQTFPKTEQKTEKLLIDAREHESIEVVGAAKVVLRAENEDKQVLLEAEVLDPLKTALQDAQTLEHFWLKCMNDWVLNFASALAYSLLMALFPIVIALAAVLGFISGDLSHQTQHDLIVQLNAFFPMIRAQQGVLDPQMTLLRQNAGFLSILAIVLAIFNGSRLFVALEDYFDIIYHTRARSFWRQNLMAISMLLIFLLLIPIMLLASSIGLGGFFGGLAASWLLFQAIYMIVPNQHISLRNSWRGALVAAFALQIYVALFPLYAENFLGSYSGNAGFAVILLLFFYYFAVILLLGAEVNAFYAEGIRGTPDNLAGLVHKATLVTDRQELNELAQQKIERQEILNQTGLSNLEKSRKVLDA